MKYLIILLLGVSNVYSQSEFKIREFDTNYIVKTQSDRRSLDEDNLRFQFSFVSNIAGPIQLSYTQRAIWEIHENSAPIKNFDFNPGLFYQYDSSTGSTIRLGYEHESNGMEGDNSRSWERLFLYYELQYLSFVRIGYKVWAPFFLNENEEIVEYQGKGELIVKAAKSIFGIKNTTREKSNKMEFSVSLGDIKLFVLVFNGYGMNIIEFDKQTNWYGLGVSL